LEVCPEGLKKNLSQKTQKMEYRKTLKIRKLENVNTETQFQILGFYFCAFSVLLALFALPKTQQLTLGEKNGF
jgi:hypothetical protein